MVLAELCGSISLALETMSNGLRKMRNYALQTRNNATINDENVVGIYRNKKLPVPLLTQSALKSVMIKGMIKRVVNPKDLAPGDNMGKIIQLLCKIMDPGEASFTPKKGKKSVVMFVGLQGSGKTTTCTKYAFYHKKKGFKPALVCADTLRAGSFDQLKQNATEAEIPFYVSYMESDPVKIAAEGVERFKKENNDLIIVDASGRHMQEASLFEEMRQVSEATKPDLVILVMDGSIGQMTFAQVEAFKQSVPVGAVIVTKMDGHARDGALSAIAVTKRPVIFIGTGEHMDKFDVFDVKRLIRRLLGTRDLHRFTAKIQKLVPDPEKELRHKLSEGSNFTPRLMCNLFQNTLKMGPIGQLSELMPKGDEKESQAKMKRYMTMMDYMNNIELDSANPKMFNDFKVLRIARDSGRTLMEVEELLEEYKRLYYVWARMITRNMCIQLIVLREINRVKRFFSIRKILTSF